MFPKYACTTTKKDIQSGRERVRERKKEKQRQRQSSRHSQTQTYRGNRRDKERLERSDMVMRRRTKIRKMTIHISVRHIPYTVGYRLIDRHQYI